MKVFPIAFILLVLGLIIGCAGIRPSASATKNSTVGKIQNSDILWDGNFFGLQATVTGASRDVPVGKAIITPILIHESTSIPAEVPSYLVPSLIAALQDKNRFVAAHVLLTEIYGFKLPATAQSWNGLKLELRADGSTLIPATEQARLIRLWADWTKSKKN